MARIGIVGAGAFTEMCLSAYRRYLPEAEIVAITDLNIDQAKKMAEANEIVSVTKNSSELFRLKSIDTVVILTPPNTHFELAKEALENDKNVLVEKPIAFSEVDAKKLIELAESRGKNLTANLVLRYHPFHQKLRRIVETNEFGPLKEIITSANMAKYPDDHWYWNPKISGGFFLNTYCHFIDLYNYVVGEKPNQFHCQQKADHAHLIELEFTNVKATLSTNLDVTNEHEKVETKYIFENGEVVIFGWLPERMTISSGEVTNEVEDELTKEARYESLLANVLGDLISRADNPAAMTLVNHEVLFETVRQPLLVSADLK